MKKALPTLALLLCFASTAQAWEGATTHAGLAEQSALASALHRALIERFGVTLGLFGELTITPERSPFWKRLTTLLSPSQSYTPDARGKMTALGWLVAGSVLADVPRESAVNHFLNPRSGKGLSDATLDQRQRPLGQKIASVFRETPPSDGLPAVRWLFDDENSGGVAAFHRHMIAAVSAPRPATRDQELARALFAAGAILHVLADMGSPSHVRDDLGAHYDSLGPEPLDVGSRFERIASLAFGRLGIPEARQIETRDAIEDYFVTRKRTGLADLTHRSWFSAYTLPRSFSAPKDATPILALVQKNLRYPEPGPHLELADNRIVSDKGVCLADVNTSGDRYAFSLSDECVLEQLSVILPQVVGFGAGLLDTLFGRTLKVSSDATGVNVSGLSRGRLSVFWDDQNGQRTRYVSRDVAGEDTLTVEPAPPAAVTVTALLEERRGARVIRISVGRTPLR